MMDTLSGIISDKIFNITLIYLLEIRTFMWLYIPHNLYPFMNIINASVISILALNSIFTPFVSAVTLAKSPYLKIGT